MRSYKDAVLQVFSLRLFLLVEFLCVYNKIGTDTKNTLYFSLAFIKRT